MGKCPKIISPIYSPYFGISSILIWDFDIWVYGLISIVVKEFEFG